MIKNGDNVILKFRIFNGELCRDNGKAYIYPSMDRALQYHHPDHEELVEYTPVVHGHWINIPPYTAINGRYNKGQECSVCHAFFVSSGDTVYSNHPYCAECGAKMDGETGWACEEIYIN